jgi:translation initiation factor IF-2
MSATTYLYSSPDFIAYPAIAADVDLMLADPKGQRRMCRRLMVQNAAMGTVANIVLQRGNGTNITCVVYGGQTLELQARKIIAAGTTATNVRVDW